MVLLTSWKNGTKKRCQMCLPGRSRALSSDPILRHSYHIKARDSQKGSFKGHSAAER